MARQDTHKYREMNKSLRDFNNINEKTCILFKKRIKEEISGCQFI